MRAFGTGLGEGAALAADFFERLAVDVGEALVDQEAGPLVELLEVIGGEVQFVPLEAKPADVVLDGFDVLGLFGGGVCVVEAEVAFAAELAGDAEVETDRLGVADVEVAVGLGGKRV